MHSPNKTWIWIWELYLLQNIWMVWSWIKAVWISFRAAEYLFYLQHWFLLLIDYFLLFHDESFLPACNALILYVWSSSSIYISVLWPVYQGWWEKSAMIRLSHFALAAVQLLLFDSGIWLLYCRIVFDIFAALYWYLLW